MPIALKTREKSKLHGLACRVITNSHNAALSEIARRPVNRSQWETTFVAHFCAKMADLAVAWKRALGAIDPRLQLSMATVFTHQTPQVTWSVGAARKRCELADLMLVIIDRTSNVRMGVAALVQAKLTSTGTANLTTSSERIQFELLSTRPIFDMVPANAPTQIDLSGLSPDSALLYGLTSPGANCIPSRHPNVHHWLSTGNLLTLAGSYSVTGSDCLAYSLVGMLLGRCGWKFALPQSGQDWRDLAAASPRDEWSTLINYLLNETFAKPLSAAHRASMGRPARGEEQLLFFKAANSLGQPMFFIGDHLADAVAVQTFARSEAEDVDTWELSSSDDPVFLSGDGNFTRDNEPEATEEPPEGGPISAVVFEMGMKDS